MIRTLLVASDGSDEAMAAVRKSVELTLSLGAGAELHVVSAIDYAGIPSVLAKQPPDAPDLLAEQAQEALQLAAAAAFASGIEVRTHLVTGEVVQAILTCAAEVGADILIAGFRGRNRIVRLVMGSAVGTLVRSTTIPVLVVREPE
jgi:nucleotide-binding universal stress UspA family protein